MDGTIAPGVSTDTPPSTTQMNHHHDMKPMWMWFHTQVNDLVLFESWVVTTPGEMVWTCFVVIAMGILLEFLRYFRWRMELANRKELLLHTKYTSRLFSFSHIIQTICFAFQLVLSYFLMLIFMTFSVWLGLAVCIGAEVFTRKPKTLAMMMKMYFHFRIREPILFKAWMATNMTGYVFSCIGVALIAAVYELIKYVRSMVERKVNHQNLCACHSDATALHNKINPAPGMPCGMVSEHRKTELPFLPSNLGRPFHMVSSSIYFVQMFLAYSLMMISMTYNVPFFLSMIIGHIITFFFLGPLISVQQYERLGDCCG